MYSNRDYKDGKETKVTTTTSTCGQRTRDESTDFTRLDGPTKVSRHIWVKAMGLSDNVGENGSSRAVCSDGQAVADHST